MGVLFRLIKHPLYVLHIAVVLDTNKIVIRKLSTYVKSLISTNILVEKITHACLIVCFSIIDT